MAKDIVRLTTEERRQLPELLATGRRAASVLTRARMLRKAAASAGGRAWSDCESAEAVESSLASVHRVRQAVVEDGLSAALERQRPTGRQYRKVDGAQEARLIAVTCSTPPEGRVRWTLQVLADRLVERDVVDTSGRECVRPTLQKTRSSPGKKTGGDAAPRHRRVCVGHGGRAGSLHPPLRPAAARGVCARSSDSVDRSRLRTC